MTHRFYHNVKNTIAAGILFPTEILIEGVKDGSISKEEMLEQLSTIAHCGQYLRGISNKAVLATKGSVIDLRADCNNAGKSQTLCSLINIGLRSAAANMLDRKYFQTWVNGYYPDNIIWQESKNAFLKTRPGNMTDTIAYVRKFLIPNIQLTIDAKSSELLMGDADQISIRFLILLEEIWINAIKALSFLEKEKRSLNVNITFIESRLTLTFENTFDTRTISESGYGSAILTDVVNSLGGVLTKNFVEDIASLTVQW